MQTQTQMFDTNDDALEGLSAETRSLLERFISSPGARDHRRAAVAPATSYVSVQQDSTSPRRDAQVVIRLSAEDTRALDRWGAIDADGDVAISGDPKTGDYMIARVGRFPNMRVRHLSKAASRRVIAVSADSDAQALRNRFRFRYGSAEINLRPIFDPKGEFVCAITEYNNHVHAREALNE